MLMTLCKFLRKIGTVAYFIGVFGIMGFLAKEIEPNLLIHKIKPIIDVELSGKRFVNLSQRRIYEEYGILITNNPAFVPPELPRGYSYIGYSDNYFWEKVEELANDFGKYPPDFFRNIGLKYVFVASSFKGRGPGLGGFYNRGSTIYIDSDGAFHHELYHMADYRDGGYKNDDRSWEEFSGIKIREIKSKDLKSNYLDLFLSPIALQQGFSSEYGMSNCDEDQAEIGKLIKSDYDDYRLFEITGKCDKKEALAELARMYPAIGKKIQWNLEFYERMSK